MAKYSANQIADWFLAENRSRMQEGDSEYITHLKLQKLLYYAQGCYLAIKGSPLFDEPILAWVHGPVVEKVYQKYKNKESNPIVYDECFDFNTIDEETSGILREVFDVFGQYSAWKLREMAHQETPWKSTRQNMVIKDDLIKEYFQQHYIEQ